MKGLIRLIFTSYKIVRPIKVGIRQISQVKNIVYAAHLSTIRFLFHPATPRKYSYDKAMQLRPISCRLRISNVSCTEPYANELKNGLTVGVYELKISITMRIGRIRDQI